MNVTRFGNKLAKFVDDKSDIMPRYGQIKQTTNESPVKRSVHCSVKLASRGALQSSNHGGPHLRLGLQANSQLGMGKLDETPHQVPYSNRTIILYQFYYDGMSPT